MPSPCLSPSFCFKAKPCSLPPLLSELTPRSLFPFFTQIVPDTYPAGLGEPLNIILSSESSPEVLIDSPDNGGFRNYILGLDFSDSCLGLVATGGQQANLGDGQGVSE